MLCITRKRQLQGFLSVVAVSVLYGCSTVPAGIGSAQKPSGCPVSHQGYSSLPSAPEKSSKISVKELASIDLGKEAPKLEGRRLRIRTITFEPGGYVLLHSHDLRPALAMVTKGELYEHVNKCMVPVLHRKGDIIKENKGVEHWVINKGKTKAVLTVSDIPDDRKTKGAFK